MAPQSLLSHLLPLLLQLRILLPILHRPNSQLHRRSTHSGPDAVQPIRPERRVLRLSKPNWPHIRVTLGVAEPEIERQVRANRLRSAAVERRRRTVRRILRLLGGWGFGVRVRVRVLVEREWGFEGVLGVEVGGRRGCCGGGGGEGGEVVAREEERE
ncbi:hypothetical protein LOK49_LG02G00490 [Camellia lanceoleosa]|uniref:Uncharacterized protein n=1 Tax=Camellia lanceoleosa TaxID=1840588 RepID=A0ACC0IQE7_9ERIC|nr:hypothetical protein LOK49_LG02G00490 [Camellia lanceoleosa]